MEVLGRNYRKNIGKICGQDKEERILGNTIDRKEKKENAQQNKEEKKIESSVRIDPLFIHLVEETTKSNHQTITENLSATKTFALKDVGQITSSGNNEINKSKTFLICCPIIHRS